MAVVAPDSVPDSVPALCTTSNRLARAPAYAIFATLAIVATACAPAATPVAVAPSPLLTVDVHTAGVPVAPGLFGLGVDLPHSTYELPGDTLCRPLPDPAVRGAITLVRIGARTADDYDWRSDAIYYDPPRPRNPAFVASFGCLGRHRPLSILRVLDRARALGAAAVVVLNGEIDDPQGAAGLVHRIAARYGTTYARTIYWEIGDSPARWTHFGVPLSLRRSTDRAGCLPDQYAALVDGYAAAIGAALGFAPRPRIVADDWIANATDQSWTGVVTAVDSAYYPFDSPDNAPPNAAAIARGVTDSPSAAPVPLDGQLDSLRANLAQYSGGQDVRLFVGRWNVDKNPNPANPLYGSVAQAVFAARLLLHLVVRGVTMAAWGQPLYGSTGTGSTQAPFVDGQPTPAFHVLAALRTLAGAHALAVVRRDLGRTADLDVLAARRPDGRITLVVANATGRAYPRLPIRLAGASATNPARQAGMATVQTFAAPTPDGARATVPIVAAVARVDIPALGVVLVTLP